MNLKFGRGINYKFVRNIFCTENNLQSEGLKFGKEIKYKFVGNVFCTENNLQSEGLLKVILSFKRKKNTLIIIPNQAV